LEKASAGFKADLELNLPDEVREKVEYYQALILFFDKQVDSSRAAFNKLIVDFPRGYYVNDAVRLMVLMDEAEDHPNQLFDYSNALLFEQRQMLDSSLAKLSLIAGSGDAVLADVALLKMAELCLVQGDTSAAIGFVDSLAVRFPESYYRPYGLKMKADILMENGQQLQQAVDIYRSLLEDYSNYPFAPAVRLKMRELEESSDSA
jgi:tetratricopeptide (TPR) repeat protein